MVCILCMCSEEDFVCFDFMPRHHSLIRFRMGRPYRRMDKEESELGANYMVMMFRRACHWSSFTLNQVNWTYNIFISMLTHSPLCRRPLAIPGLSEQEGAITRLPVHLFWSS